MKVYCKYRKPRVSYWGSSYLSERFGIQSILNKGKKMPLEKNDVILLFVPHEYATKTGLLSAGCCVPRDTNSGDLERIIGHFMEYDDFGGLWIHADYGEAEQELMIPRDIISFILINPTTKVEKEIGFKLPDEYKKLLDK